MKPSDLSPLFVGLQNILRNYNGQIEGNLVCDIAADYYTIDRNLDKIRNLQYLCKNKKRICEIGVNACHSLLLMILQNPFAEYYLFDLNNHPYTEPCLQYVRDCFPNTKIVTIYGNSMETLPMFCSNHSSEMFDLCHLDGGHTTDVFTSDYDCMQSLMVPNAPIIFDDYDLPEIKSFIDQKKTDGHIVDRCERDIGLIKTVYHFIYSHVNP